MFLFFTTWVIPNPAPNSAYLKTIRPKWAFPCYFCRLAEPPIDVSHTEQLGVGIFIPTIEAMVVAVLFIGR